MNIKSQNTETPDAPPEGGPSPVADDQARTDADAEAVDVQHFDETEDSVEEQEADRTTPGGGRYLAETFAATGLLLILGLLAGVRVLEVLPSLFAQSQEGVIAGILLGEGATAVLAALFAAGGLAVAKDSTHTWVRWVAPATIIVGLVLAVASGGAYLQVPEPQPQPPMIPGG